MRCVPASVSSLHCKNKSVYFIPQVCSLQIGMQFIPAFLRYAIHTFIFALAPECQGTVPGSPMVHGGGTYVRRNSSTPARS